MQTRDPEGSHHEAVRAPVLARGATIGRYLVLGLVGKGGMGEVYAAYDPELDRKIAVKLLRAQGAAGTSASEGRARLLREAQAIARLSDPNVVVVYDVGTFEDRVFLAMEFVEGNTLGYWLEAKARGWREVVETFAAAGRGLAAAHRAGVVHRDFKPDNVMIGRDGKVRVMDFGLARAIDAGPPEAAPAAGESTPAIGDRRRSGAMAVVVLPARPPAPPASVGTTLTGLAPPGGHLSPLVAAADLAASPWTEDDTSTRDLSTVLTPVVTATLASPLASPLTMTGAMMGTPIYMAPEQFQSKTLDARTDQFSFCVALYEGLYGERPFTGKTIQELSENVSAGRLRPAPPQARVPGWLRRVLLRGLRVDSSERHPSMEALLVALTRDPSRARRRWAAAAAVVSLVGVLAVSLVREQRQQRTRCLGADAKLAGIWELPTGKQLSPRKEAIRRAFVATGKRYAADSFTMVANALDRYVIEWTDMHRESCEATNVRGEQSAEVLDLRTSCLNDRFAEVRALANVFSDASGEVVSQSVTAVQAMRPVGQCADIAALRAVVRPPDDVAVRRAVAEVRMQLADVKALANAGRYKQGLKEISRIVQSARDTKYAAVIAEALLQSAKLLNLSGEVVKAERAYEEAVWLAEASHHDEVKLEAADELVVNVGQGQNRHQDAQRWSEFAAAILRRLGPGHDTLAAWHENNLAMSYCAQGRFEPALVLFERATAIKVRALGEAHFDVAISLGNVAITLHDLGRTDEAIETNQRALAIARKELGPDHPVVARALANGAEFERVRGHHFEAEAMAGQALASLEKEYPPDHLDLTDPLSTLGQSVFSRGDASAAVPFLERALAIRLAKGGAPVQVADSRFALAQALAPNPRDTGRALELAEQARTVYQDDSSLQRKMAEVNRWIDARRFPRQRLSMR